MLLFWAEGSGWQLPKIKKKFIRPLRPQIMQFHEVHHRNILTFSRHQLKTHQTNPDQIKNNINPPFGINKSSGPVQKLIQNKYR